MQGNFYFAVAKRKVGIVAVPARENRDGRKGLAKLFIFFGRLKGGTKVSDSVSAKDKGGESDKTKSEAPSFLARAFIASALPMLPSAC